MIQKLKISFLVLAFLSFIFLGKHSAQGQNSSSDKIDLVNLPDGVEKLDAYLDAIRNTHNNNPDSALSLIPEALKLAKTQKDLTKEAEILFSQSSAFSTKGLTNEALESGRQAIRTAKLAGDSIYESRIISFLGTIYGDMGNFEEAAKQFNQALQISVQQNDSLGIINGYLRLGVVQSFQNQEKKAIEYYEEALVIARAAERQSSISSLLNNIGTAYGKQELYKQALIYLHEAELLERERIGEINLNYFTQLLSNIGQAYYHLNNYSKSLDYLVEAEEIILANGESINPIAKVNNNVNIGRLYTKQGEFIKAEKYLNEALAIAYSSNSLPSQQVANEELTEYYIIIGEFEKALETSRLANDIRDSIYNAEKFEIIENLNTRYEVEKKDAELALLTELNKSRTFQRNLLALLSVITLVLFGFMFFSYSNKIRSNQELLIKQGELEEINDMKDKLFSIIGHDLRGPFQGILGGLLLIQDGTFHNNEKEKKELVQKLIESGKATHEVLESLLIWGKAQSFDSNPEKIDSKKITEYSIRLLREAARQKDISIVNNATDELTMLADKKEIEFVLRNLINNAIKYTNPGGQISLKAQKAGNQLKIDIIDNGVGIPSYRIPSILEINQIQSTSSTKNEAGSGLGLVVCHDLVTKNKGKIKVESELGHGSKFSVYLPLA